MVKRRSGQAVRGCAVRLSITRKSDKDCPQRCFPASRQGVGVLGRGQKEPWSQTTSQTGLVSLSREVRDMLLCYGTSHLVTQSLNLLHDRRNRVAAFVVIVVSHNLYLLDDGC